MRRKFSESLIDLLKTHHFRRFVAVVLQILISLLALAKFRQPSCDYFTSGNVLFFVNGKHSFGGKSSHHYLAVVSISFFLVQSCL